MRKWQNLLLHSVKFKVLINIFDFQKVDARKLEKAEAKLQQKQQKQKEAKVPVAVPVLQTATASQVTSKKDSKLEAKGTNRTQDIRIENFDIAYGDRWELFFSLLGVTLLSNTIATTTVSEDYQ